MVEDQNFHKVKSLLFLIFYFFFLTTTSFSSALKFQKIVDLNDAWGSTFVNNSEILITEKSGKIKLVNISSKKITEIEHNLNYLEHGQGGLLDILFENNFVYVSYTENRGNWKTSTSIAKARFNNKKFSAYPYCWARVCARAKIN